MKVIQFKIQKVIIEKSPLDKLKSDPPKYGYIAKVINFDKNIIDQIISLSKD